MSIADRSLRHLREQRLGVPKQQSKHLAMTVELALQPPSGPRNVPSAQIPKDCAMVSVRLTSLASHSRKLPFEGCDLPPQHRVLGPRIVGPLEKVYAARSQDCHDHNGHDSPSGPSEGAGASFSCLTTIE
jgi:hypothetical protein